jgi:hypothetical protein
MEYIQSSDVKERQNVTGIKFTFKNKLRTNCVVNVLAIIWFKVVVFASYVETCKD